MNKNLLKRSLTALPLVGAVAMVGAMPAQASLEGTFSINPRSIGGSLTGGLTLEGTGLTANGNPLTNIDFGPPLGPSGTGTLPPGSTVPGFPIPPYNDPDFGNGAIVELAGTDDFFQFETWEGIILDLAFPNDGSPIGLDCGGGCQYDGGVNAAPFPVPGDPTSSILGALTISNNPGVGDFTDGGFTVQFDFLGAPVYTAVGTGTAVLIPIDIQVFKLDEMGMITSDEPSTGTATLSATFSNLAPAALRSEFDEPGELFRATTWQLDANVSKAVPEPASILGLLMVGLGGVAAKTLQLTNKN